MGKDHHPAIQSILDFFEFEHLPSHLQDVSRPFSELAHWLADYYGEVTEHPAELTVALRKLLESKDAAVRAALK